MKDNLKAAPIKPSHLTIKRYYDDEHGDAVFIDSHTWKYADAMRVLAMSCDSRLMDGTRIYNKIYNGSTKHTVGTQQYVACYKELSRGEIDVEVIPYTNDERWFDDIQEVALEMWDSHAFSNLEVMTDDPDNKYPRAEEVKKVLNGYVTESI
jgi:hypothetical protein